MLNGLKKNNKKGFTLVELIVVLVILAILAALLVPALTGYIDRAKTKSVIAETRQAVIAAQTLVDEAYAKADVGADTVKVGTGTNDIKVADIQTLAEVKGTIGTVTVTNGKVEKLEYTKSGKLCTYQPGVASNTDGDYNIANAPAAPVGP